MHPCRYPVDGPDRRLCVAPSVRFRPKTSIACSRRACLIALISTAVLLVRTLEPFPVVQLSSYGYSKITLVDPTSTLHTRATETLRWCSKHVATLGKWGAYFRKEVSSLFMRSIHHNSDGSSIHRGLDPDSPMSHQMHTISYLLGNALHTEAFNSLVRNHGNNISLNMKRPQRSNKGSLQYTGRCADAMLISKDKMRVM